MCFWMGGGVDGQGLQPGVHIETGSQFAETVPVVITVPSYDSVLLELKSQVFKAAKPGQFHCECLLNKPNFYDIYLYPYVPSM